MHFTIVAILRDKKRALQIRQSFLAGHKIIAAADGGADFAQQQIGFSVQLAKHAQLLLFDIAQAGAVGNKHQPLFAAGVAIGQALADDFQPLAVFF